MASVGALAENTEINFEFANMLSGMGGEGMGKDSAMDPSFTLFFEPWGAQSAPNAMGEPEGILVDLAKHLCHEAEIDCVHVIGDWSHCLEGNGPGDWLLNGFVDACVGVKMNAARMGFLDYSPQYTMPGQDHMFALSTSLASPSDAGVKIGGVDGWYTNSACASTVAADHMWSTYDDVAALCVALESGAVDMAFIQAGDCPNLGVMSVGSAACSIGGMGLATLKKRTMKNNAFHMAIKGVIGAAIAPNGFLHQRCTDTTMPAYAASAACVSAAPMWV